MRHQNSKRLFKYWDSLRAHRAAPDRREIEPSDIREILGDTFILELDRKFRSLSFRLAGTRLCNAYGRELKGIGFLSLWDERHNLGIYKCVRNVFEEAQPCVLSYSAETEQKRTVDYEMLLLPLLNGPENASRILGVASPIKSPIWLGSDPLDNNLLKFKRFIDPTKTAIEPEASPSLDPSDTLENERARKVGHLTIIDGGID